MAVRKRTYRKRKSQIGAVSRDKMGLSEAPPPGNYFLQIAVISYITSPLQTAPTN